jgi:hypothetical protein
LPFKLRLPITPAFVITNPTTYCRAVYGLNRAFAPRFNIDTLASAPIVLTVE